MLKDYKVSAVLHRTCISDRLLLGIIYKTWCRYDLHEFALYNPDRWRPQVPDPARSVREEQVGAALVPALPSTVANKPDLGTQSSNIFRPGNDDICPLNRSNKCKKPEDHFSF